MHYCTQDTVENCRDGERGDVRDSAPASACYCPPYDRPVRAPVFRTRSVGQVIRISYDPSSPRSEAMTLCDKAFGAPKRRPRYSQAAAILQKRARRRVRSRSGSPIGLASAKRQIIGRWVRRGTLTVTPTRQRTVSIQIFGVNSQLRACAPTLP